MSEGKFTKAADNLWLYSESGVFYARKSFKKLKLPDLFESTGEVQIRKAKAKLPEMIRSHVDHHSAVKKGEKKLPGVAAEILETVTPTRRKGTQENHKIYLTELSHEWNSWVVNEITLAAWANWLTGFRRRKKRKTFADYQKTMNMILRYAYKQRYCSHLLTLPNPDKRGARPGRVYTQEEITSLWGAMSEETRDQFVLCFECFMRLREALHLTWDRLDLESGVLTLRPEDVKTGSKTGKGRSFKLSPHALERLRSRRLRVRSEFVFPSPGNPSQPIEQNKAAWCNAKRKAGVVGRARWHDLRHTALTVSLLERRMDVVLVSEYAGVSIRTLQRVYLHSTADKTASVAGSISVFSSEREVK